MSVVTASTSYRPDVLCVEGKTCTRCGTITIDTVMIDVKGSPRCMWRCQCGCTIQRDGREWTGGRNE